MGIKTNIIDLANFKNLSEDTIKEKMLKAIEQINKGEVIAFPTETVYGLGANAFNETAVEKIFKIKGRPADNPLIVHVCSIKQAESIIDFNDFIYKNNNNKNTELIRNESRGNNNINNNPETKQNKKDNVNSQFLSKKVLLDRFQKAQSLWPGPISFIFPAKKDKIPSVVRGGLSTVAIRLPDHLLAQILIKNSFPLAAPSANISGKPSCTNYIDVINDFNGKISYVIDGGHSVYGIESTVVDCTSIIPTILRPGFITQEDLYPIFPDIVYSDALNCNIIEKDVSLKSSPKSPGMKYTHYKPEAKVVLLGKNEDKYFLSNITKSSSKKIYMMKPLDSSFDINNNEPFNNLKNKKILILKHSDLFDPLFKIIERFSSDTKIINFVDSYSFAQKFYALFRQADREDREYIFIEPYGFSGFELAIMNRLQKAMDEIWTF